MAISVANPAIAMFIYEGATKNKIKYQEVNEEGLPTSKVVGMLYMSKSELGKDIPTIIEGTFKPIRHDDPRVKSLKNSISK